MNNIAFSFRLSRLFYGIWLDHRSCLPLRTLSSKCTYFDNAISFKIFTNPPPLMWQFYLHIFVIITYEVKIPNIPASLSGLGHRRFWHLVIKCLFVKSGCWLPMWYWTLLIQDSSSPQCTGLNDSSI